MAINARTDQLIPIKNVRRHISCPPSQTTVRRWYTLGIRNRISGRLVFLEIVRRGRHCFTTAAAIDRFIEECSSDE